MEINQNKNELHLYPINNNEYMGAIDVKGATVSNSIQTVVILDSSGSMGQHTGRFVKEILPSVMSKLNWNGGIDLINFSAKANWKYLTLSELVTSDIQSHGLTNMGPAIRMFRLCLESIQQNYPGQPIRVLVVSDGAINDHENAVQETKKLIDFLATTEMSINLQAVRLFTSTDQPDTKALSYLLQINNTVATELCDIKGSSPDEAISSAIAALFQTDWFANYQTLQLEKSIVLKFPWDTDGKMQIILSPGWNIFWLKAMPTGAVKLRNCHLKVIVESQLSLPKFHQLIERKLTHIIDHVAILKVVGTTEANTAVDRIFAYFKMTEDALAMNCSARNVKILSNLLVGIAKKRINNDSAEMAEFLRSTKTEIEIQLRRKKEADEADKKEVEERRIKREEDERIKRLQEKRIEEAQKWQREQSKIKEAEEEHCRREEEERRRREEEQRHKREEEERLMREEEEHRRREEEQRRKREEEERRMREEKERRRCEEEERRRREEEQRHKREEEERLMREEEEHRRREEEQRRKREEEERRMREVKERRRCEEEERCKREEEERRRREEEQRRKWQEEENDKRKVERINRLKHEEEERRKREEEERRKHDEEERLRREEENRRKRDEEERLRREDERRWQEEENKKREEEQRIKREEQEREEKLRLQRESLELNEQKKLEAGLLFAQEKIKNLELQRTLDANQSTDLQHINEKLDFVRKNGFGDQAATGDCENVTAMGNPANSRRIVRSIITTATNKARQFAGALRSGRNRNSNQNPIQTVFILHENVFGSPKKHCRFAEKIVPIVFSKISHGNSQLVHLLTVTADKTPVVQMLQSILQTLDANKPIRIVVLTDMNSPERQQFDNFADILIKFLSGSNFTFEFQVIRVASESQELGGTNSTKKYQLVDIDEKKSNAFIAAQIVELFHSDNFQKYEPKQFAMIAGEVKPQPTDVVSLDVDGKQSGNVSNLNCESCRANKPKHQRSYCIIYLVIFAIPIILLLFDILIYTVKV